MQLFLTSVLPFLAHNHASAAAFLTCRHHNFHSSVIPEFVSDEEKVQSFCKARQHSKLEADKEKQFTKLFNLFVQTPLMQFSPSLIVFQKDCFESILKPLLATKYFTRTLQRCSVVSDVPITSDLLQGLSKVQSLTNLDLGWSEVKNEQLEIIIHSFPSLETLTSRIARQLKIPKNSPVEPATAKNMSPPPPAAKTLRSLALNQVDTLFAAQFFLHFPNLRKLELAGKGTSQKLDLHPLTSSLPHLTNLDLEDFPLENTESLKNLVHLSSLEFYRCRMNDLSFLSQENALPNLTTLCTVECRGFKGTPPVLYGVLCHAPNLRVLKLTYHQIFKDGCVQYLEKMIHLRILDLSYTQISGDSDSLKTLMKNSFQLEELNLCGCLVGNQGANALYDSHSRLRVLNLSRCRLVDADLDGIGALKNSLEVLDLNYNRLLTDEALLHLRDLFNLKNLDLTFNDGIKDLSPLKDCLNLEELDVSLNGELRDASFKVFSEEPNSFPNLRVLSLSSCQKLTEKTFEHLSKNNHLVNQLHELNVRGMSEILASSSSARSSICQLRGLRSLRGIFYMISALDKNNLKGELMRNLKNLEEVD